MQEGNIPPIDHVNSYLGRLYSIQQDQTEYMESLLARKDIVWQWARECELSDDADWKALEDKLNHIYRTYQRM